MDQAGPNLDKMSIQLSKPAPSLEKPKRIVLL